MRPGDSEINKAAHNMPKSRRILKRYPISGWLPSVLGVTLIPPLAATLFIMVSTSSSYLLYKLCNLVINQ
jgi:hypothetical protein